jgi:hypothetical protein
MNKFPSSLEQLHQEFLKWKSELENSHLIEWIKADKEQNSVILQVNRVLLEVKVPSSEGDPFLLDYQNVQKQQLTLSWVPFVNDFLLNTRTNSFRILLSQILKQALCSQERTSEHNAESDDEDNEDEEEDQMDLTEEFEVCTL